MCRPLKLNVRTQRGCSPGVAATAQLSLDPPPAPCTESMVDSLAAVAAVVNTGNAEEFLGSLFYFVAFGAALLFVGWFVALVGRIGVAFVNNSTQSPLLLKTLRSVAQLASSVLFIPALGVLFRWMRCDGLSEFLPDQSCWVGLHAFLSVVVLILTPLFIALTVFTQMVFIDRNPLSDMLGARSHGRVEAVMLLAKVALVLVFTAFLDVVPVALVLLLCMATSVAWICLLTIQQPFIVGSMNDLRTGLGAVFAWVTLMAAYILVSPTSDIGMLSLLGVAPCLGLGWYASKGYREMIMTYRSADLRTWHQLDLWSRARVRLRKELMQGVQRSGALRGSALGAISSVVGPGQGGTTLLQSGTVMGRGEGATAIGAGTGLDFLDLKSSGAGSSLAGAGGTVLRTAQDGTSRRRTGAGGTALGSFAGWGGTVMSTANARGSVVQGRSHASGSGVGSVAGHHAAGGTTVLSTATGPGRRGAGVAGVAPAVLAGLLRQAEGAQMRSLRVFSGEGLGMLSAAAFFQVLHKTRYMETVALLSAKGASRSLDIAFFVYQRTRQMREESTGVADSGSGLMGGQGSGKRSLSAIERVLFDQHWHSARESELACYRAMLRVWQVLGDPVPDLNLLQGVGTTLKKSMHDAQHHFKAMLRIHSDNSRLQRSYGSFLLNLMRNPSVASQFLNKADALEANQSNVRSSAVEHLTMFKSSSSISATDESVAVFSVDGSIPRIGTILKVNSACTRLFQRSRGELLGQNMDCLLPHPIAPVHDTLMKRFATSGHSCIVNTTFYAVYRDQVGYIYPARVFIGEAPPEDDDTAPRFNGMIQRLEVPEDYVIFSDEESGYRMLAASRPSHELLGTRPSQLRESHISVCKHFEEVDPSFSRTLNGEDPSSAPSSAASKSSDTRAGPVRPSAAAPAPAPSPAPVSKPAAATSKPATGTAGSGDETPTLKGAARLRQFMSKKGLGGQAGGPGLLRTNSAMLGKSAAAEAIGKPFSTPTSKRLGLGTLSKALGLFTSPKARRAAGAAVAGGAGRGRGGPRLGLRTISQSIGRPGQNGIPRYTFASRADLDAAAAMSSLAEASAASRQGRGEATGGEDSGPGDTAPGGRFPVASRRFGAVSRAGLPLPLPGPTRNPAGWGGLAGRMRHIAMLSLLRSGSEFRPTPVRLVTDSSVKQVQAVVQKMSFPIIGTFYLLSWKHLPDMERALARVDQPASTHSTSPEQGSSSLSHAPAGVGTRRTSGKHRRLASIAAPSALHAPDGTGSEGGGSHSSPDSRARPASTRSRQLPLSRSRNGWKSTSRRSGQASDPGLGGSSTAASSDGMGSRKLGGSRQLLEHGSFSRQLSTRRRDSAGALSTSSLHDVPPQPTHNRARSMPSVGHLHVSSVGGGSQLQGVQGSSGAIAGDGGAVASVRRTSLAHPMPLQVTVETDGPPSSEGGTGVTPGTAEIKSLPQGSPPLATPGSGNESPGAGDGIVGPGIRRRKSFKVGQASLGVIQEGAVSQPQQGAEKGGAQPAALVPLVAPSASGAADASGGTGIDDSIFELSLPAQHSSGTPTAAAGVSAPLAKATSSTSQASDAQLAGLQVRQETAGPDTPAATPAASSAVLPSQPPGGVAMADLAASPSTETGSPSHRKSVSFNAGRLPSSAFLADDEAPPDSKAAPGSGAGKAHGSPVSRGSKGRIRASSSAGSLMDSHAAGAVLADKDRRLSGSRRKADGIGRYMAPSGTSLASVGSTGSGKTGRTPLAQASSGSRADSPAPPAHSGLVFSGRLHAGGADAAAIKDASEAQGGAVRVIRRIVEGGLEFEGSMVNTVSRSVCVGILLLLCVSLVVPALDEESIQEYKALVSDMVHVADLAALSVSAAVQPLALNPQHTSFRWAADDDGPVSAAIAANATPSELVRVDGALTYAAAMFSTVTMLLHASIGQLAVAPTFMDSDAGEVVAGTMPLRTASGAEVNMTALQASAFLFASMKDVARVDASQLEESHAALRLLQHNGQHVLSERMHDLQQRLTTEVSRQSRTYIALLAIVWSFLAILAAGGAIYVSTAVHGTLAARRRAILTLFPAISQDQVKALREDAELKLGWCVRQQQRAAGMDAGEGEAGPHILDLLADAAAASSAHAHAGLQAAKAPHVASNLSQRSASRGGSSPASRDESLEGKVGGRRASTGAGSEPRKFGRGPARLASTLSVAARYAAPGAGRRAGNPLAGGDSPERSSPLRSAAVGGSPVRMLEDVVDPRSPGTPIKLHADSGRLSDRRGAVGKVRSISGAPSGRSRVMSEGGASMLDDGEDAFAATSGRTTVRQYAFDNQVRKRIIQSSVIAIVALVCGIIGTVVPVVLRVEALQATDRLFLAARMQVTSARLSALLISAVPGEGGVPLSSYNRITQQVPALYTSLSTDTATLLHGSGQGDGPTAGRSLPELPVGSVTYHILLDDACVPEAQDPVFAPRSCASVAEGALGEGLVAGTTFYTSLAADIAAALSRSRAADPEADPVPFNASVYIASGPQPAQGEPTNRGRLRSLLSLDLPHFRGVLRSITRIQAAEFHTKLDSLTRAESVALWSNIACSLLAALLTLVPIARLASAEVNDARVLLMTFPDGVVAGIPAALEAMRAVNALYAAHISGGFAGTSKRARQAASSSIGQAQDHTGGPASPLTAEESNLG